MNHFRNPLLEQFHLRKYYLIGRMKKVAVVLSSIVKNLRRDII